MRHQPPFINRPWVESEQGRADRIGQSLDCVRCDRFELPDDFEPYKRTPQFDQASVPAALTRDHQTKAGVWARIRVERGRLRYVVESLAVDIEITSEEDGIVVPEVPHFVEPLGEVVFSVEFYRAAPRATGKSASAE